jgi:hypothetical protein
LWSPEIPEIDLNTFYKIPKKQMEPKAGRSTLNFYMLFPFLEILCNHCQIRVYQFSIHYSPEKFNHWWFAIFFASLITKRCRFKIEHLSI